MSDNDAPTAVTDAELTVLEFIWRQGPTTIRDAAAELYPSKGPSGHATVQKLLERLERKGAVERDRRSFAHVFSAQLDRDEFIGQQLEIVAQRLCGGSLTPLLTHLVAARRLTGADRRALRRMLDEGRGKS